jgi:hypothetical protein
MNFLEVETKNYRQQGLSSGSPCEPKFSSLRSESSLRSLNGYAVIKSVSLVKQIFVGKKCGTFFLNRLDTSTAIVRGLTCGH